MRTQNRPRSMPMGRCRFKGVQIRAVCSEPGGKLVYLGSFATVEEAAKAYDDAAVRFFGEAAITNRALGLIESEVGNEIDV